MTEPGSARGRVHVEHFSDLLCVWAYVGQVRLDELRRRFGDRIAVRSRFCSVFADVAAKLAKGWRERGGLAGYRAHVEGVVRGFDHVELHPDTWVGTVPSGSAPPQALVKAAELAADPADRDALGRTPAERLAWRLRLAFFRDGRDISRLDEQLALAGELGLSVAALRSHLEDGRAWAALLADYAEAAAGQVRGSPTYLLNERRQVLYGNVGYRIVEANVLELLEEPGDRASWC